MKTKQPKETIKIVHTKPEDIRYLIQELGNNIGSVSFKKRKDGSVRKMAFRLHVKKPKNAKWPFDTQDPNAIVGVDTENTDTMGAGVTVGSSGMVPVKQGNHTVLMPASLVNPSHIIAYKRKSVDLSNCQITVFDVNKVNKDKTRGAYRTIPLENILEMTINGTKYIVDNAN